MEKQDHAFSMSLIKELVAQISNKNDKTDHKKEIEELKKQVDALTKAKANAASRTKEYKSKELKKMAQRNKQLENELSELRKKDGALPEDSLKDGQEEKSKRKKQKEKINKLEKEMQEIKILKDVKEHEAQEIDEEHEVESKNNELIQLLTKLSQQSSSEANTAPSSKTATTEEAEILKKFTGLLDLLSAESSGSKTKECVNNAAVPTDKNSFQPPLNNQNAEVFPNTSSPSYVVPPMHQSGSYPDMAFMGMPGFSGNPNMMGFNPLFQPMLQQPGQFIPPPQGVFNQPPGFPTTYQPMNNTFGSQTPSLNQPNIVSQPNNLNMNKSSQSTPNKNVSEKKHSNKTKEIANSSGKEKSGPPNDLWSQLDQLKEKIKDKNATKSALMSEVFTLMSGANASTSITSKEKFLEELSECAKPINDLPDKSNNTNSINLNKKDNRKDFKKHHAQGGAAKQRGDNEGGSKNSSEGSGKPKKKLNVDSKQSDEQGGSKKSTEGSGKPQKKLNVDGKQQGDNQDGSKKSSEGSGKPQKKLNVDGKQESKGPGKGSGKGNPGGKGTKASSAEDGDKTPTQNPSKSDKGRETKQSQKPNKSQPDGKNDSSKDDKATEIQINLPSSHQGTFQVTVKKS